MAPTPATPPTPASPAQAFREWLNRFWQQSQGQVPGGPDRIGNVSAPPPGDPRAVPVLPPATSAEPIGPPGPPASTEPARRGREAPPPEKPYPDLGSDQYVEFRRLQNRLWEMAWAQHEAQLAADDPEALPDDRTAAANRVVSLSSQITSVGGQVQQEVARIQTDREQAAQRERQTEQDRLTREAKPARGTPLPAVRKTYTPPGGTPVSAWVPQIADGNGGSQDDPNGTPTLDTSLIGQAVSGGETGAAQRGVELETARLNLRVAQQKFDEAASPEAKERARLELETAKLGLAQAQRVLDKPSETTADGYLVRVTPGGEVTRIDTLTPEQRAQQDELAGLTLEKARLGAQPTFTDATAAYNAQVPRLQQAARQERDRLLELQRQGAISEADAERQFTQWFAGNVETPLAGYRTAAEEAQRKEQREQAALQRAEDVRAENANRARETVGYNAGEQARAEAMRLAPQGRSPQFLAQLGSAVAGMSARAGAKSAEEAAKLPAGARFTPDTFNPANFAGSVPNLDEVARSATARALAAISPSVAARIGAPMPQLPTGPTLQGMLSQIPYRGGLAALPSPTSGMLPTPGMEAIDLAGSRPGWARTHYGPTGGSFFDWELPR